MGGAASFILFGTLMLGEWQFPWRTALALAGGAGLRVRRRLILLFRNTPRTHPWANTAEADLITLGDAAAAVADAQLSSTGSIVFRSRVVWALLFQQFTCAFVDNFFSAWLPQFLDKVKHVTMTNTGWMAAVPLVGGAIGGMAAGGMLQSWLLRKTGNRRWSRSGIGLVGNLMAGVCLFTSLAFDDPTKIIADVLLPQVLRRLGTAHLLGGDDRHGGPQFGVAVRAGQHVGFAGGFVAGPVMGYTIDFFGKSLGSGGSERPGRLDGPVRHDRRRLHRLGPCRGCLSTARGRSVPWNEWSPIPLVERSPQA